MLVSSKTDLELTKWKRGEPFLGLVLLSLDNCIVWSPHGKPKPSAQSWVWAVPEDSNLIAYFQTLFDSGFLPLFYSIHTDEVLYTALAADIAERKHIVPPVMFDTTPAKIYGDIAAKGNQLGTFASFVPNFAIYTICSTPVTLDVPNSAAYTFDMLGFAVENRFPKSGVLVLMGQPGSGKSTLAAKLKTAGWKVYDEKEAGKLKKGQVGITRDFKHQLEAIKGGKLPGIVVDATNPTQDHRRLYLDMATAAGVEYHTGWVTRPGWEFNKARKEGKVPDIALYTYSKRLKVPAPQESPIRLI